MPTMLPAPTEEIRNSAKILTITAKVQVNNSANNSTGGTSGPPPTTGWIFPRGKN